MGVCEGAGTVGRCAGGAACVWSCGQVCPLFSGLGRCVCMLFLKVVPAWRGVAWAPCFALHRGG
jgi:hypothetical protein